MYIYIVLCITVFFRHFGTFFSSRRGSILVLSAPWHAASPPGPRAQVWALAEVRGTCSGKDSEHVRVIQAHANPLT